MKKAISHCLGDLKNIFKSVDILLAITFDQSDIYTQGKPRRIKKMTRFEKELSGALGAYWKKEAEKELEKIKAEIENGEITIDEAGVARNCIGRVLMDDMLEKVAKISNKVNAEATKAARNTETSTLLNEYRKNYKEPSAEEKEEMIAAFGKGTTVVDLISKKRITL